MADRRRQREITDTGSARKFLAAVVECPDDKTFSDVLAALTVLYRAGEL